MSSWWIGLSRTELGTQAPKEQPRMAVTYFGRVRLGEALRDFIMCPPPPKIRRDKPGAKFDTFGISEEL